MDRSRQNRASRLSYAIIGFAVGFANACGSPDAGWPLASIDPTDPSDPSDRVHQDELTAYCEAAVRRLGTRDVEDDYIPHVVACENGGADLEALRAQAIAARSYLYYRLQNSGSIADGQADQVYRCGRDPEADHFEAARSTRGEVLTYRGSVIAAFYVAGAIPSTANCIPARGDSDAFDTERYVTYNKGQNGDSIDQTSLGWIDRRNDRNRGCSSQNGAQCLARRGLVYQEILEFYHGSDIAFEVAEGPCVPRVDPDAPTPMEPTTQVGPDSGDPSDSMAEDDTGGCTCVGSGSAPLSWPERWAWLLVQALAVAVLAPRRKDKLASAGTRAAKVSARTSQRR